jgi:hypothetical protein
MRKKRTKLSEEEKHWRRSAVLMAAREVQAGVPSHWIALNNTAEFLQLVANKLDGIQEHCRDGDYDPKIIAAYEKVRLTPRGMDIRPRFADFKEAFASEWQLPIDEYPLPNNYSLRRSLKRLGLPVSDDKRGAPPKLKK